MGIYWAGLDQLDIQYELSPGSNWIFFLGGYEHIGMLNSISVFQITFSVCCV
jgi:hypothetical protein